MEELLKMLLADGYNAEIVDIEKADGYTKRGLQITKTVGNKQIGKIYYDVNAKDFFGVIEDFNADKMLDFDKMIDAMSDTSKYRLCIRPKTNDDIVTREFLDLELYVRVDFGDGSIAISNNNLPQTETTVDNIFGYAMDNAMSKLVINKLSDAIKQLEPNIPINDAPIFVITYEDLFYGASTIAFVNKIFNDDMYLIPSSKDEIIAIPAILFGDDKEMILEMKHTISGVNSTFVLKEDVLSDNLYMYDNKNKIVKIVE